MSTFSQHIGEFFQLTTPGSSRVTGVGTVLKLSGLISTRLAVCPSSGLMPTQSGGRSDGRRTTRSIQRHLLLLPIERARSICRLRSEVRAVPNPCPCSGCYSDRRQLTPPGPGFRRFCSSQLRSACDRCWPRIHGLGTGDTGQPAAAGGYGDGIVELPADSANLEALSEAPFNCLAKHVPRYQRNLDAALVATQARRADPRAPPAWSDQPLQASLAARLTTGLSLPSRDCATDSRAVQANLGRPGP